MTKKERPPITSGVVPRRVPPSCARSLRGRFGFIDQQHRHPVANRKPAAALPAQQPLSVLRQQDLALRASQMLQKLRVQHLNHLSPKRVPCAIEPRVYLARRASQPFSAAPRRGGGRPAAPPVTGDAACDASSPQRTSPGPVREASTWPSGGFYARAGCRIRSGFA